MKKTNKGFTIVELVIVIAVIAILAAVLIPTFSGVVQNANESAALSEARAALTNALTMSDSGSLPSGTIFAVNNGGKIYYFEFKANQLIAADKDDLAKIDTAAEIAKIIVSNESNNNTEGKGKVTADIIAKTIALKAEDTKVTTGLVLEAEPDVAISGNENANKYVVTVDYNEYKLVTDSKVPTTNVPDYYTQSTNADNKIQYDPASPALEAGEDITANTYYTKVDYSFDAYYTSDMLCTCVIFFAKTAA